MRAGLLTGRLRVVGLGLALAGAVVPAGAARAASDGVVPARGAPATVVSASARGATVGAGAQAVQGSGDAPLLPGDALARQRQCLGCHQVDVRRVGPPFQAIARRFRGQPQAVDHLARVIRQGSSGQWGAIPMPAQTRLSEQDAHRLAEWILSLSDGP